MAAAVTVMTNEVKVVATTARGISTGAATIPRSNGWSEICGVPLLHHDVSETLSGAGTGRCSLASHRPLYTLISAGS